MFNQKVSQIFYLCQLGKIINLFRFFAIEASDLDPHLGTAVKTQQCAIFAWREIERGKCQQTSGFLRYFP